MNDQLTTNVAQSEDDEIDLLELLSTILNGKWLILGVTLLSLLLALIYAFGQQPIYKADALLQVESESSGVPGLEDLAGLSGDDASVGTELEIIKSRKILGQAVKELRLDITAQPKRVRLLGNAYKHLFNQNTMNKPPMVGNSYAWGNESIRINRLEVSKELLNTVLILIKTGDNTFKLLQDDEVLLSGTVGQFTKSKNNKIEINVSELQAQEGTKFTVIKWSNLRAIGKLQKNLKASEKGKKTGIVALVLQGQNKQVIVRTLDHISKTYLQQNKLRSSEEASNALKFLEEQIKPVQEEADVAEAAIKYYRTTNKTADLSIETQAVLDVVASIDTELQHLYLKRDELKQRYNKNHPTIQALNSQEARLNKRKEQTLSKISELPETQQELLKLERDYKVANSIYTDLLNNIQEFKIAKASSVGNVYIIDTAVVHDKPIKPKKAMILALGGLLGIMLGMLIVFIRKALHQAVNNPDRLEAATSIPVYATVPFTKAVKLTKGLQKNQQQKTLLAIEEPTDPAIESLRSLRTTLHFSLLEAKNNIVMITGPAPGIGKSFIASNFSAVISASEQRVLLIDADMRRGYLHSLMNKEVSPGLSDLISGKVTLEETINTVEIGESSFDIITRGQTPPNPSELLMHSSFEELLNQLSSQYDLIIIDTPPVHAATDPTIIGKHSGVVFMVVRFDRHSMKEIEHAVTRLAHTGIETKGFIFNGYEPKKGVDSYVYHSYSDYKSDG